MPPLLAQEELEPCGLQRGDVAVLGAGVGHEDVDVDDVFCREAGDAGGADVLDGEEVVAEGGLDALGDEGEGVWPGGIGVDDFDGLQGAGGDVFDLEGVVLEGLGDWVGDGHYGCCMDGLCVYQGRSVVEDLGTCVLLMGERIRGVFLV